MPRHGDTIGVSRPASPERSAGGREAEPEPEPALEPEPEPERGLEREPEPRASAILVAAGRRSERGDRSMLTRAPSVGAARQLEPTRASLELKAGANLGSGSFADVYRGEYRFPGRKEPVSVAFKVFRGGKHIPKDLRAKTRAEAELGARLHHPNLVQLFGVVERDDIGMALVMELCEGDSLRHALDDAAQTLSWELRTRWLLQIAEGMAELHSLL